MNVQRAVAAVVWRGGRVADDEGSEVWFFEPARDVSFQNTSIAFFCAEGFVVVEACRQRFAFAGDDKDPALAFVLAAQKECAQCSVGFGLEHSMQVDAGFDINLAGANFAHLLSVEVGDGWR
jgi:hypothetical protein